LGEIVSFKKIQIMKKIINLLALAFILTGLSSCLKDTPLIGPDAKGALKNIVEFQNINYIESASGSIPLYIQSFDIKPSGTSTLVVNYAGVGAAPADIAVKVALSPAAITQFNTDNGTTYEPMPTNLYSLSSLDLVIPKGQRTASITISVKPDQFNFDLAYALAFKITSASNSVISGNFGTVLISIGAKNKYDGNYNLKTTATTSLQASLNHNDVPLVTVNATDVKTNLLDTYANIITYRIDPVTNKVTVLSVVNSIGTPITDPISNYNPATKVMHVVWTAGTRSFDETYTYTSSR
jgi:hypothetical protein